MKKITGVLLTVCILAGTMLIASCNLINSAQNAIRATYNRWYKYTGSDPLGNIPLGSDENDTGTTDGAFSLQDAEYYFYYDEDAGLKLAVQAKSEQNIEILNGLASTKVDVYMGGTKQYTKEEFGALKWAALVTNVSLTSTTEPMVSKDPDSCIILMGEDASDFKIQWKKVLARMLFKKLLGEDL